MSEDVQAFGQLVRQRRKALKLTQEALAAAALNNLDRKGMISRIENGKIPNITHETVKKVAEALSIDVEEIPASLRWTEAVEVVRDTNTVVHEVQATTDRIEVTTERLVQTLSHQALDFKIKEGMLIALARRYAEGNPNDFDAAYAGLEQALEVAAQDRERGKLSSNTDDAVNAVIARVDALNDTGDIDVAATLLAEEEARAEAGLMRLYEKGIAQAIITRNVDAAVAYELKKLPSESSAPEKAFKYLHGVFLEWYNRGNQGGLNFDGEVAIALMRNLKSRFEKDKEIKNGCLINLGTALRSLGQRQSGTMLLEEAVTVYRAVLSEWTRASAPYEWALVQMNLGNALKTLGERESGTERLVEAVIAYRDALVVWTRDRAPINWAILQMNLGASLVVLGQREKSTERLEEAVAVFRAVLDEGSRDGARVDLAKTQMNLAAALLGIGEREKGTEHLQEAIAASRAALHGHTRDRAPLEWARTQMNLGAALSILGQRESDAKKLEEAVIAYRSALLERTRDRAPHEWARTQMNLGAVLSALGEHESSTKSLEQAVVAFRKALQVNIRDQFPLDWAGTLGNEAITLMTLADRTKDAAMACRARDQLIEAETVLREAGHDEWADRLASSIPKADALLTRLPLSGPKE